DPYREELKALVGHDLGQLDALWASRPEEKGRSWRPETTVVVAGQVLAMRKRGDSQAFVLIEDGRGRLECAFFAEEYFANASLLTRDRILVIEGGLREDEFSGGFSLRARRCWDFAQVCPQHAQGLSLKLDLNNPYLAGVSIEQPVYMGGKIHSAYRMARIGDELAALNVCLTEEEVIVETDRAYWTYVQTLELRKSAGAYKAVVEEFLRTVSNAVEAGMKSRNDLMKVQVQLNRAELQLQRADNGVQLSRMNLCQMVGLPLDSDIVPSESFGDETAPAAAGTDITARPEYTMLCKQVELKRQEQRFIQSDFLPSVGVRGGYYYTYGMKINGQPLFDNGGFSAMIAVSIPLFHWGEGMNKVRAAKAETAMAELQRDEMAEKMELEAQQALNAVNEYILEVRLTESALSQAEENMQTSGNFYEAGMEPISDYLEAQAIWQNASAEYIAARAKLAISRSEYMKAAGLL
ncbi:MAG: TolC family protein, partial [Tidjanibacter sp.]|nr:TolC family protein [Tidjanibacter sp.]